MEDAALRAAQPDDAVFFYRVISETMRDHVVATWGKWDTAKVESECTGHAKSPNANVIVKGGIQVGVVTIAKHREYVQLEQLYLLPAHQRQGLGTKIVQHLIAESRATRIPIRLRVLRVNPATRFYERLGFAVRGVDGERVYMEYAP